MAPRARFELATNRLTAGCSTTELPRNIGVAFPTQRAGACLYQSVLYHESRIRRTGVLWCRTSKSANTKSRFRARKQGEKCLVARCWRAAHSGGCRCLGYGWCPLAWPCCRSIRPRCGGFGEPMKFELCAGGAPALPEPGMKKGPVKNRARSLGKWWGVFMGRRGHFRRT